MYTTTQLQTSPNGGDELHDKEEEEEVDVGEQELKKRELLLLLSRVNKKRLEISCHLFNKQSFKVHLSLIVMLIM